MYAAIRRYQLDPQLAPDVINSTLNRFVPLIKDTVISYYVMDVGKGAFATISICEDAEKVQATNRSASECMKQYLASCIVTQEEIVSFALDVDDPLQGFLYEGVAEPVYKRSLQLLSVQEVGELLGMGRSWVYNQIKSGELPSVQLGGSLKVKREDLEEYIENHRR